MKHKKCVVIQCQTFFTLVGDLFYDIGHRPELNHCHLPNVVCALRAEGSVEGSRAGGGPIHTLEDIPEVSFVGVQLAYETIHSLSGDDIKKPADAAPVDGSYGRTVASRHLHVGTKLQRDSMQLLEEVGRSATLGAEVAEIPGTGLRKNNDGLLSHAG